MKILAIEDFLEKEVSDTKDVQQLSELLRKYKVIKLIVSQAKQGDTKVIARPKQQRHEGVVKLKICKNFMTAIYEKNSDFIKVVKQCGMSWNYDFGWTITENERTGFIEDICAEVGNKLLKEGFLVQFDSEELLEKAVNANFESICTKWIDFNEKEGIFRLTWRKEENLYDEAMTLPGARYRKYGIDVPERFYLEVLDFAERHDYRFTEKAETLLNGVLSGMKTIEIKSKIEEKKQNDSINNAILEDLKDED